MYRKDAVLEGGAVPLLRYRDVTGAIDWLCNTLGFEKHLRAPHDTNPEQSHMPS